MDFHLRHGNAGQGIPDRIAVMGVGPRVDDNALSAVEISFLYPVDDGALVIALEYFDLTAGTLRLLFNHIQQILIILCSIYIFFTDPQEIDVWSVDHQKLHLPQLLLYLF